MASIMDALAAEKAFCYLLEREALRLVIRHWRELGSRRNSLSRTRLLDRVEKFRFDECHGGC